MAGKRPIQPALGWLLEEDSPGVRYLALRDLADNPSRSELRRARTAAHKAGPIAAIIKHMKQEGYWSAAGPGYHPKYRSTVWSLIMLAQLGASLHEEPRVGRACEYVLDHALTAGGQFSASGGPAGTADCLQGNLCWALLELGCRDSRLESAFDWMARTVTGEGLAPASVRGSEPRYYAGKCGPDFGCGSNNRLSCAWGGVKVMLALGKLPPAKRTSTIERAIRRGVDFFFSVDPSRAEYPCGYATKPSGNWWKFGFPVFYVTDLLQLVEALVQLGYGRDKRLEPALDIIREKQDGGGRWLLEYDYAGKTWLDFGKKAEPNKWVTLRALRVLKAAA